MMRLNAGPFVETVATTSMIERMLVDAKEGTAIKNWDPNEIMPPTGVVTDRLIELKRHLTDLGASFTLMSVDRVLKDVQESKCKAEALLNRIRVIHGRIRDELDLKHVYIVSDEAAKYLSEAPLFGDGVAKAFPSAAYDIAESGKCLAFRRSTACVTHLMRALEVALVALGKQFGVETAHTNWHTIIDQIESKIRAMNSQSHGVGWKDHQAFYAKCAVHFRMLKDGWRNYAMHVREKYTEEEAEDIYRSTRSFMRHLSQRLSELEAS